MQKKYFGLLLVLCMILAVLPFVLSAGAADSGTEVTVADSAPTVYVKESVETRGDGLSAETAFKTLTEAYAALQVTGGTIVICDTVTLTNTSGLYELSVNGDYQYYVASQCGDAVKITSIASTAEDGMATYPGVLAISEFVLRSDHIFENITISPATSGASISANGNDLTIGENVECTTFDSNYPLLISGMFLVSSNTYLYYADDTLVWADTQEKWANKSDSYFVGKHWDEISKLLVK